MRLTIAMSSHREGDETKREETHGGAAQKEILKNSTVIQNDP